MIHNNSNPDVLLSVLAGDINLISTKCTHCETNLATLERQGIEDKEINEILLDSFTKVSEVFDQLSKVQKIRLKMMVVTLFQTTECFRCLEYGNVYQDYMPSALIADKLFKKLTTESK